MKTITNNIEVSDRTYYYLLDFNDRDNKNYMRMKLNKNRLMDLDISEYIILFNHATMVDMEELKLLNK